VDDGNNRLRIKEWAEEDRPREKLLLKGVSSLSNAELLAILIQSGSVSETAVQLSQNILASVSNNLNALGKLTVGELKKFNGVGDAKAIAIIAAMELGRRRRFSDPLKRDTIRCSKDAFEIFYPLLCDLPHEELWIALTNAAQKVTGKVRISQGGTGETGADLSLIMKEAINNTCHGIMLCHNHPSGNLQPSPQDDLLTSRVNSISQLLNIKLLDHIIISDNNYYSFADEGRI
jgi:DNA repair protein RadC